MFLKFTIVKSSSIRVSLIEAQSLRDPDIFGALFTIDTWSVIYPKFYFPTFLKYYDLNFLP